MKARELPVGIIVAALILLAVNVSWANGRIEDRLDGQRQRINQGLRSGAITDGELDQLDREQWRIERALRRAWSNGHLSPRERHRLLRMLDEADDHISWAKNNRQRRYAYRSPRRPHVRPQRRPIPPRGHISGLIMEPGWSIKWSFGLD